MERKVPLTERWGWTRIEKGMRRMKDNYHNYRLIKLSQLSAYDAPLKLWADVCWRSRSDEWKERKMWGREREFEKNGREGMARTRDFINQEIFSTIPTSRVDNSQNFKDQVWRVIRRIKTRINLQSILFLSLEFILHPLSINIFYVIGIFCQLLLTLGKDQFSKSVGRKISHKNVNSSLLLLRGSISFLSQIFPIQSFTGRIWILRKGFLDREEEGKEKKGEKEKKKE